MINRHTANSSNVVAEYLLYEINAHGVVYARRVGCDGFLSVSLPILLDDLGLLEKFSDLDQSYILSLCYH